MNARIATALVFAASAAHAQIPLVTDPTAGQIPPMRTELWQLQNNLVALSARVYQMCLQQRALNPQLGVQCIPPVASPLVFQLVPQAVPERIPQ